MTSLAALIAVAGYLNHIENSDKQLKKTSEEVTMPEETMSSEQEVEDVAGEISTKEGAPGEAVLVNAVGSNDFIVEAKLEREENRMLNKEMLMEIVNNTALSEEQKSDAVKKVSEITDISQREQASETMLKAKGYENVVVTITDDSCDVLVEAGSLDDAKRAQIEEIVKSKTMIPVSNITITTVKTK